MHKHVSVREGAAISCPKCGGETRRYGYEKEERTWQHGNVFFIYSCYVHCRRPRVLCPRCGVQQAEAPFARKNSRNTLLFEGLVMLIAHDTLFSSVARLMGCNEKTAVRIVSYWVNESRRRQSLEKLSSLAVDETSMRHGHVYVVRQIVSGALGEVRKQEQKETEDKRRIFLGRMLFAMPESRLTNAICEGINSGIQAAKRKARGYKTFRTFSTMIYLIAGKLDIKSPFPMPA